MAGNDLHMILRVAARQVSPEKIKDILLKLRKKAFSSLSAGQLVAALESLGGWKIDTSAVGLKSQSYGKDKKVVWDRDEEHVRRNWDSAKADEVQQLPANPVKGKKYTMDVSDIETNKAGDAWKFTLFEWFGVPAVRFISPEGKSFDLIGRDGKEPMKTPVYDIAPWLYKETGIIDQISKALDMRTPDEEKADKAPRTRNNTGSCPCCFGNYKIRSKSNDLPEMVLHGFKRPGWGEIHGRCFGVSFPPFELSPKGTEHLIKHLQEGQDNREKHLRDLKSGKVTSLYIETSVKRMQLVTPESEGAAGWEKILKERIREVEWTKDKVEGDIRTLTKLVNGWELKPLPEEGRSLTVWK